MSTSTTTSASFYLGRVFSTPGAMEALAESNQHPLEFLQRHASGDWGEVCDEDKSENEISVREGFRILSGYSTTRGTKLWVETSADRSSTTILLPEEY